MDPVQPHWDDWFRPVVPSAWLQATFLVALIALLASFAVAYFWRRTFPGPLTRSERRLAKSPAWRRQFERVLIPALAAVAGFAAMQLIWPLRRPQLFVLHSRARPAGAVSGLVPAGSSAPIRDLGPVVDSILEACANSCAGWMSGSLKDRDGLRRLLHARIDKLDVPLLEGSHAKQPPASAGDYPGDLIESIELSLVQMAARHYNALEFAIAPRPYYRISNWQVARQILGEQGTRLRLVDELPASRERLAVTHIAGARLKPNGTITFWAVFQGKLPQDVAVPFDLRELRDGADPVVHASFKITLPADDYLSRIVAYSASVGGAPCPSARLVLHQRIGALGDVPVGCVENDLGPPRLFVPAESAARWQGTFDVLGAGANLGEANRRLGEELRTMGLDAPLVVNQPVGNVPVLLEGGESDRSVVVVGANRAAADEALGLAETASDVDFMRPEGSFERVITQPECLGSGVPCSIGPPTVFSFVGLPLAAGSLGTITAGTPVVVAAHPDGALGSGRAAATSHARAWAGALASGRFVALDLPRFIDALASDATHQPNDYDPFVSMALVRGVAWAARYVEDDDFLVMQGQPRDVSVGADDALVGPLVSESEIHNELAGAFRTRDVLAIFAIGVYLLSLVWRIRHSIGLRS